MRVDDGKYSVIQPISESSDDQSTIRDEPVIQGSLVNEEGVTDLSENTEQRNKNPVNLTVGQRIKAISSDRGKLFSGKIMSRAAKVSGKYKHWYNIETDESTIKSMDVQRYLQSIEEIGEDVEMLGLFNFTDVLSPKEKKVQSWKNNDVYEEVENLG